MKKSIELTPEQARQLYKSANSTIKQMLELSFSKSELLGDGEPREFITSFEDVLEYLGENKVIFCMSLGNKSKKKKAFEKLIYIEKCFNRGKTFGDYYYYPYFNTEHSGLVFHRSFYSHTHSHGAVARFTCKEDSDYVGKTFLDIYTDFHNND